MIKMFVAKSYEGLEVVEPEYSKNGKFYCKVRAKNGKIKEVRVYSEMEYRRLYPETAILTKCNHRKLLGFDKGYITIFRGNIEREQFFFEQSTARLHAAFGWYFVSTDEIPKLPDGIEAVKLYWEEVGNSDNTLRPIEEVKKIIYQKLYKGE